MKRRDLSNGVCKYSEVCHLISDWSPYTIFTSIKYKYWTYKIIRESLVAILDN